jgi:hypothetical protein
MASRLTRDDLWCRARLFGDAEVVRVGRLTAEASRSALLTSPMVSNNLRK